ncbi:hypothetical protein [uncultured Tenacibaculum sp.]|uniref:hypothetical protein n=1 Tax=uncultured Tenacibaculum sp. TaxID=174713 RepID=UPI002602E0D1|nr:hypothetical protein [uncultured Tenacibaculum sp.]
MKKVLLLFFAVIYSANTFSQAFTGGGNKAYRNTLINYLSENLRVKNNKEFYEKVSGTVFVQNSFIAGRVNESKEIVKYKYNAYNDQILINDNNGEKYFNLLKGVGNKIQAINSKLSETYIVFKDLSTSKSQFFKHEFNTSGDKVVSLLTKQKVVYVKGKQATNSYQSATKPKFNRLKDQFFVSLDDRTAVEVPRSKKKFIALFENKEKEIKTYMKENRKSHKKRNELIDILKYYATI